MKIKSKTDTLLQARFKLLHHGRRAGKEKKSPKCEWSAVKQLEETDRAVVEENNRVIKPKCHQVILR